MNRPATRAHLTMRSENRKVGPIPVSTTAEQTCPPSCAMRDACYAKSGPLALHWRAVSSGARGMEWSDFCRSVASFPAGTLWRYGQAGDLPGVGERIDRAELLELTIANIGRRPIAYSHKPVLGRSRTAEHNRTAIADAVALGFTVNLSANDTAHADALADLGIAPVACVLPSSVDGRATRTVRTPAGRTVVVCPATYRDDTTCASCQLCAIATRTTIVGFPAHGTHKARASRIASRVIPINPVR